MKKDFVYLVAVVLLLIPTCSFSSWWQRATRRVSAIVPTPAEALKMYQRDQGQLQAASQNLYSTFNTVNQYRSQELTPSFFANNPNFLNDINDLIEAATAAKDAAYDFKKTAEQVKGETWQKGLVEEPALAREGNGFLVLEQPEEPRYEERTCPLNGDYQFIGDFEEGLE